MAINGWSRARRITGAVLLMLVLAVFYAGAAQAEPRIKISRCEIYDTNRVDPIAFSRHLHHQFGNTSTTNSSTGTSLFNNEATSCMTAWFTSAGWFPVERYEPVSRVAVYYRAPGDQTEVRAIPKGLQLLGTEESYRCDNTSGEESFQDTPPYGCTQQWAVRVFFPDCWNKQSLQETSMVNSNGRGECPSTHPYRIPKINYLIQHENADGNVPNPLRVSAGVDAWEAYTFMHADYFAANQSVLNLELLDLCLRSQPDWVNENNLPARCG